MATSTNFDPDFVPTDDEYSSEDSYSDGDEDTEELVSKSTFVFRWIVQICLLAQL